MRTDRSDRELWTAASFGELFDRHAKAVYNHCFRLTASWAAAEDHVQTVFLLAWRKRAEVTLRHESALPWLLAVATNVVRNDRRATTRWQRLVHRLPAERSEPDHADDVAGRIDDERRMALVLATVARLPRAQRDALALCVWSGVSYPDAAVVLGIAEGSVRARVSKAKARLGRLLGSDPVAVLSGVQEER
ncbi:RNA polymerase sigma factor [Actinophytocola sp.]|uniref:RNA polymerase sigma factor n=1 Tax=Actinophytocola sp. TaxID=1872138 RepID=UPI002D80ABB4|nr:RNA polymerase sigma factor [Actinophytocola sp.]HET9138904.1 RNA polymerase sigma factor [Actinophytocola sp.]